MSEFLNIPLSEFDTENSMITPTVMEDLFRDMTGIDTCVMTAFPNLEHHALSRDLSPLYNFSAGGTYVTQYVFKDSLIVANMPTGGPAAAALMEELISLGVIRFIAITSAGLLDKKFDEKKLMVVTDAIRDEGTSYHYLPAGEQAYASPLLTEQFKQSLRGQGIAFEEGRVWTTDAIYRETPSRVERRKNEGAIAVDTECASLCAVAQFRGVEFASAFYFSDFLLSDIWSGYSADYDDMRAKSLQILLETGLEVAGLL